MQIFQHFLLPEYGWTCFHVFWDKWCTVLHTAPKAPSSDLNVKSTTQSVLCLLHNSHSLVFICCAWQKRIKGPIFMGEKGLNETHTFPLIFGQSIPQGSRNRLNSSLNVPFRTVSLKNGYPTCRFLRHYVTLILRLRRRSGYAHG